MFGGLASISLTVSYAAQNVVDSSRRESRDAFRSEPCSHATLYKQKKSAERGQRMSCALCLNISHLQSDLMNYSDGAICCASHLKHLPCQLICQVCLAACTATGSFQSGCHPVVCIPFIPQSSKYIHVLDFRNKASRKRDQVTVSTNRISVHKAFNSRTVDLLLLKYLGSQRGNASMQKLPHLHYCLKIQRIKN